MPNQKKLQWIFACVGTLFLFRAFYFLDPTFLSFAEQNILTIVFGYGFALPGLLWIAFFANQWLYNLWIGQSNLKMIINYEQFQIIFTIFQFIIMFIIILGNLKWIK